MSRTQKARNIRQPKPVRHIEVSDKHVGLRLFLVILFIGIAVAAFAVLVATLTKRQDGWQTMAIKARSDTNYADQFVLRYYFEGAAANVNVQYSDLQNVYTQLTVDAYRLYDPLGEGRTDSLAYLNAHPNQTVQLETTLYNALSLLDAKGIRTHYAAPIQQYVQVACAAKEDYQAFEYDPIHNPELRAWALQVAAYCTDPDHIKLRFLGDNKVSLDISQAYLAFAEGTIDTFVDLGWLRNAFVADYIANNLQALGYTAGVLASYDGYTRSLYATQSYTCPIISHVEDAYCYAATATYTGNKAVVNWQAYPTADEQDEVYYRYENGDAIHCYFDATDCLCHNSTTQLVGVGQDSCAAVAVAMMGYWLCDTLDAAGLADLATQNIATLYADGNRVLYTDGAFVVETFPGFDAVAQ